MRAYQGAFLDRFEGHAVCVGPVLHYQVMGKGFHTLAYSPQVLAERAPIPLPTGRGCRRARGDSHDQRPWSSMYCFRIERGAPPTDPAK